MAYLLSNISTKNLLESDNYCWNYRWWLGFFETQYEEWWARR